nr:TfoX/Sxy family protein [Pinisolibacter aquiterrae]
MDHEPRSDPVSDVEFYLDLCRPLGGVTSKRMFGGLCLWHEGLAFALVIADTLYLKVDAENGPAFDERELPRFSYETKTGRTTVMSYARAPEVVFDDPDVFADWARGAIGAARRAAAAKPAPRKPRATRA